MLCDPVLAFVKAFRLRGSNDSLKRSALAKFDDELMSKAKRELWESDCSGQLRAAGLPYQARRGSGKRSQAAADLDDILAAFDKLDETADIPDIFCEATDFVKLPPIVCDAVSELIHRNGAYLQEIQGSLDSLSQEVSNVSSKLADVVSRAALSPSHPLTDQSAQGTGSVPGAASQPNLQPVSSVRSKAPIERRDNLVVFGIAESQSLQDTMASVH